MSKLILKQVFRGLAASAVVVFFLTQGSSCNKVEKPALYNPPAADTISYTSSDVDFPNPERGFYRYTATYASNFSPLDVTELKGWRNANQADGGNYQVVSSLVFRYYILDGLTTTALPTSLLDNIKYMNKRGGVFFSVLHDADVASG